jgi:hypothetical protein
VPVTVLASASPSGGVAPGALGFLVVAALALALVFLFRSMNKQLRKVSSDKQYFSERPDAGPAVTPEYRGDTGQDS